MAVTRYAYHGEDGRKYSESERGVRRPRALSGLLLLGGSCEVHGVRWA